MNLAKNRNRNFAISGNPEYLCNVKQNEKYFENENLENKRKCVL